MNFEQILSTARLRQCLLVVAAAAWAPGLLHAQDAKSSQFYEDALQRFQKQDYAGTILQLKNVLKINNKNLSAQLLLGNALFANSEVAAAEVAFEEAIRLGVDRAEVVLPLARAVVAQGKLRDVIEQPRFAMTGLPPALRAQLLLVRSGAMADLGDPRAAIKSIEEARTLDPTSADSWVAEVPIRVRMHQMREALAAIDKALAITPTSADAIYLRGTVLHVQGDRNGALAAYDRALKALPTHKEALVSRAGLLLDMGRLPDASIDIAELLKTSPREPRAQYLRAVVAERQGDAASAKAALNQVTALLDPVPMDYFRYRPQILMLGGMAHYGLNEKEKAKPYLEGVLRIQPQSPAAKLLAQIYLSEKNIDRGVEALDAYLRGQPNDGQAMHLLASAHMSQGRYVRAAQLLQDALRLGDQPSLRALLGLSLVSSGKTGNAVTELEATLRKDPSQIQAATALATIYMQSGQFPQALKVAEGLIKQQPNNPGVLNVVGLVRASARDIAGARTAFEQAIKIDPAFVAPHVNLARLDRTGKNYDKAITRLEPVLRADEKNVEALGELGLVLELNGRPADAQRLLEKAADHSGPQDLDPALALVEFHLRKAQPDLAREAAKRLTAKAPDDLRVLITLARVNLALGDTATARTSLSRAASMANYDAGQLLQIALLQLQAGHLAGAAYSLDKALTEQPEHLPAQALMAEVELKQGEPAKSEKRARQIVAKYPKLGVGYALLGDVARSRNDRAGALDAFRRAHQIDQSTDSFMRLYGAQSASDAKAASQIAEQWVKGHPGDAVVRRAMADGHARDGNLAAARAAYESLLKLRPDDVEAMNNLANVMIQAGDHEGALKVAQAALQKEPGRPYIIGTAGWASFKVGQPDKALQLLRDARLRDPNNLDTRYFLAAVLANVGRKAEAVDELQAAFKVSRNFSNAKQAEDLLNTLK